jgi:hypothetical protein
LSGVFDNSPEVLQKAKSTLIDLANKTDTGIDTIDIRQPLKTSLDLLNGNPNGRLIVLTDRNLVHQEECKGLVAGI